MMSFKEAMVSTLYDNIFNIDGRAPRSEFNWFLVFQLLIVITFVLIYIFLIAAFDIELSDAQIDAYASLVGVYILVPSTTVSMRRLNDLNLSKWLYFLIFVPEIATKIHSHGIYDIYSNLTLIFNLLIISLFGLCLLVYMMFAKSKPAL